MINYEKNLNANMEKETDEKPGHRAEKIVGEFIQETLKDILTKVEKTSRFDQNDRNGVDYVFEIKRNGRFAADITFAKFRDERSVEIEDDRRKLKEQRFLRSPCVILRDEQGKAISEKIPRLLIDGGRNMNFWFMLAQEAEKRGSKLVDYMDQEANKDKRDKTDYYLNQIVSQIIGMSARDVEYRKKSENGLEVFKAKADELGIDYPGRVVPHRKKQATSR